MTEYIVLNPPHNIIDGIPASIAGEWPGIKPNKFPKTKKIIKPKTSNIFSLDNSFPVQSRKKRITPNIKQESTRNPQKRRVCSAISLNKLKTKDFYDLLPSSEPSNRLIINRIYDFEKRAKYYKMIQENFDKKMKENEIMNKAKIQTNGLNNFNNNGKKGFNKQFFENVSKNKILQVTLDQDIYYRFKNKIEKMKKYRNELGNKIKKRRLNSCKDFNTLKRMKELNRQQEKLTFDINYVSSLE